MVKRITAALLGLLIILLTVSALAAEHVEDRSRLFAPEQITEMNAIITRIRDKYKIDAAVLTTGEVPKNKSESTSEHTADFADEYFDKNGFGIGPEHDGVLFLIDMNNRLPYISTKGIMIDYLDDARLNEAFREADKYLQTHDYGHATVRVLEFFEKVLENGIRQGHFRYDDKTGERLPGLYNRLTAGELVLALIVGVAAGMILYFSVFLKYRLKFRTYRFSKATQSSVELSANDKTFIRESVSRTHVSSGSGGGKSGSGSGVHFSSGGGLHGGGAGRHF